MLAILAVALAPGRYSLTQQGNMAFELDRYTVLHRFDQRGRFRAGQTDAIGKVRRHHINVAGPAANDPHIVIER